MKYTKHLMWTGITATILIAVLFIASLIQGVQYGTGNIFNPHAPTYSYGMVTLYRGGIAASHATLADYSGTFGPRGWHTTQYAEPLTTWSTWVMLPRYSHTEWPGISYNRIQLPLWLPFLVTAIPTTFLIRTHHRTTRRARAGNCPKCNYNLNGLSPRSPCPECGATPPPREVPR